MAIKFPGPAAGDQPIEVEHPSRIVVVGANGSGKTRLGIWLEDKNQNHMPVHRVAAQKALNMPDFAQVKNLEQAEKELYFGRSDQHASLDRKIHDRWGGSPATHLLSDYDKLLALLFAKEAERDRSHAQQTRTLQAYVPVPDSAIDQIVKLWGYLMPHRSITFHDGKVTVGKGTTTEYHAKEMSDGERVTLYLLGQCLTAPSGSLVVIDEPELHLHRSLMDKLWNKVEELCPDKSIVYITHDLDFAASRAAAKKVWVHAYAANAWTWSDLPQDETLPESLVLELVGSRKPVLFCEGERGGLDHSVYQLCYPTHHVVPRGSAEKVAESVKALNANEALHSIAAFGLIDRDVKTTEELSALVAQDIHAIPFAEVENLLCNEQMVRAVAAALAQDPDTAVRAVTDFISRALTDELEVQIVLTAARRIRYHLSCYSPSSQNRAGLQQGVDTLVASLDLLSTVGEAEAIFQSALANAKLDDLLKVYNRKSLADRISVCFGLKHGEYVPFVFRLLKGKDSATYIDSLRSYLPNRA
jgi:energy-coupling factor transporter ATP-binding protein EcfA2